MLDAHAHLCLLAFEEEKVNLGRFLWRCSRAILYRELVSFHANPWKGDSSWADYRGRGEARSPEPTPTPLKITKNRVSKHTSPVPLKITKQPSQHSMLGHQSAKRQFNGVSLAGQWWPAFVVFGSSLPSSTKKNVVKVGPPPLPRTKFSGWVIMFYVRSQGHHVLTTTAVALILDIMLSLRLCLRPTIIADSLGPDLAQQNV